MKPVRRALHSALRRGVFRDDAQALEDRVRWLRREIQAQEQTLSGLKEGVLNPRQLTELEQHNQRVAAVDGAATHQLVALLEQHNDCLRRVLSVLPLTQREFTETQRRPLTVADFPQLSEAGYTELPSSAVHDGYSHSQSQLVVSSELAMLTDKVNLRSLTRETFLFNDEMIWATFLIDHEQYYLTYRWKRRQTKYERMEQPLEVAVHAQVPRGIGRTTIEPQHLISSLLSLLSRTRARNPRTGHRIFDTLFMVRSEEPEVGRYLTRDLVRGLLEICRYDLPWLRINRGMARVEWSAIPTHQAIASAVRALGTLARAEVSIYQR